MKKVLSSILISFIIFVNLLAPFSVRVNKNNIEINKNEVKAEEVNDWFYTKQTLAGNFPSGETSYELCKSQRDADIIKFSGTGSNFTICTSKSGQVAPGGEEIPEADPTSTDYYFTTTTAAGSQDSNPPTSLEKCEEARSLMSESIGDKGNVSECKSKKVIQQVLDNAKTEQSKDKIPPSNSSIPSCGLFKPIGCAAQIFYYVLFVPTSYLFALSGVFFDNTFAYSVQDTSYRSAFVVEGWGLARDICNMFFIFVLLYIAIGTTLSLHSVKTKETIINVVIIGLFINFSLFATQLIIDASNITARVFYNADTIEITENGANGVTNATPGVEPTKDGIIPLSAALVNKVNPQNLIIHADQLDQVETKDNNRAVANSDANTLTAGKFIIIVLIASAVNIVGFIVFLSIGMIFIARVVGLWMAMILAPLAFFTYILPEQMAGIKMIGWKNWWPETLKLAFLAPVFIFFLYLILKFLELDLIADAKSKSGLTFFIATLMPFAFIMIMLMKAKKLATEMSGSFGEFAAKVGASVGGATLGLAAGGAAMAMRGTLGNLGSKIGESNWAQTHGRLGRMVGDAGKWTAGKTFDARNTKLGAEAGKSMGVDMGKAKEGGYTKHQEEVTAKRRERAESLKLKDHSEEVQELHKTEERLSILKNESINDTNRVDGTLEAKRKVGNDLSQKLTSANSKLTKAKEEVAAQKENLAQLQKSGKLSDKEQRKMEDTIRNAETELNNARSEAAQAQENFDKNATVIRENTEERTDLNASTGMYSHKTANGLINKAGYDKFKKDVIGDDDAKTSETNELNAAKSDAEKNRIINKYIKVREAWKQMQDKVAKDGDKAFEADELKVESMDNLALKIIPELHHHVEHINAARIKSYSEDIRGRMFNKRANDKAAHEAIMGSEVKKH